MSIHVSVDEFETLEFPHATGWVVDPQGYLHVTVKDNGNCATFQPRAWTYVSRVE